MTGSDDVPVGLSAGPLPTVVVIDVANVMGSRPDGWWRDRAAAASRLIRQLAALHRVTVAGPHGEPILLARLVAVVEGRARDVAEVDGVDLRRAGADGDDEVYAACVDLVTAGGQPLAVTADRQLRGRLPAGTRVAGPGWLLGLLSPE